MTSLRNIPCPCGSGKKLKYCCDRKSESVILRLKNRFSPFSLESVAGMIAALMAFPENHAQTYRLKIAMQAAILTNSHSVVDISAAELKTILLQELPSNGQIGKLEDPQEALFTTLISTHGGNFIVYPEVFLDESVCLKNMLDSVFARENSLPTKYLEQILDAFFLLLNISTKAAEHLGHTRYMSSPERHGQEIYIPDVFEWHNHMQALWLTPKKNFETLFGIFSCTVDDENLLQDLHEKSPLHTKPFIKIGNKILIASIHNICSALISFIIKKTSEHNLVSEFTSLYRKTIKQKVYEYLHQMGFGFIPDIPMPKRENSLYDLDGIFQFDSDKFTYVRIIIDEFNAYQPYHYSLENRIFDPKKLIERASQIINTEIVKLGDNCETLILSIYAGCGREFTPLAKNNQVPEIALRLSELETLMLSGDIDSLSLWKFHLAEKDIPEETQIRSFGFLDKYVFYKEYNSSFYFSDRDQKGVHTIFPGYANLFRQKTYLKKDIHFRILKDDLLIETKRRHHSPKIPIYKPTARELNPRRAVVINKKTIWVKPTIVKKASIDAYYLSIMEACAYWIWQSAPVFKNLLASIPDQSINLEIDFQNPFAIRNLEIEMISSEQVLKDFQVGIDEKSPWLSIPDSWFNLVQLEDNQADRTLLIATLAALFLLLPKDQRPNKHSIEEIVDEYAPLGSKTMLHKYSQTEGVFLDSSNLATARIESEPEISIILNNLVHKAGIKLPVGAITDIKLKNQISNRIVSYFFSEVQRLIRLFPTEDLLMEILALNEAIWQKKQSDAAKLPALLSCFENIEITREELIEKSMQLETAAIAHRSLIEFIISTPSSGNKKVNDQDTDMMLALSKEITSWGMLSDDLDSGLNDIALGILESGRIGTGKYFNNQILRPYAEKKRNEHIEQRIDEYGNKEDNETTAGLEQQTLDQIYLSEFGITKTDLNAVVFHLHLLNLESKQPIMQIEYKALAKDLSKELDLEEKIIENGLAIFCLENRKSWDKIPAEFDKTDIYPWRYNRKLSYLRRPLIRMKQKETTGIYYGHRQLILSFQYLEDLIATGRYQAVSTEMKTHIGKMLKKRGDDFNNEIFTWLKKHLSSKRYLVYKGVKLNKISKVRLEDNLGDVDLLIIDKSRKLFISVECKNVNAARTSNEFVSELNRFEGDWIEKHLKRHRWASKNVDVLRDYYILNQADSYQVMSIFVTSEVIPYSYIRKQYKELLFKDFEEMKRASNVETYFDAIISENTSYTEK